MERYLVAFLDFLVYGMRRVELRNNAIDAKARLIILGDLRSTVLDGRCYL
ncbi:predicted protein [Sclerotinia sclerotiorum 1980 UF-70]|uniref:Uncharacterized protein n=1 Tax=Sclerotinia sclerotiorum (strain ATCC 18683 / 1980 / Ss-1) TaxID=665079 RepID=A7EUK4_SCLS1|nr:predicted protein [Sclerotinia sclerotiorum 1980 UF-70]EDN93146.1 predicted protein [Sclerotinia sclerotiorum 1980 UF-70]